MEINIKSFLENDPILSYQDTKELDHYTQKEWNLSEELLMGLASKSFLERFRDIFSIHQPICILSGKGNNGGDGYALGYFLSCENYSVEIYEESNEPRSSASKYYRGLFLKINPNRIHPWSYFQLETSLNFFIFVDCILGTGARGELSEPIQEIQKILSLRRKASPNQFVLIALDHPTLGRDFPYTFLGELGCTKLENIIIPPEKKRTVPLGFPIHSFLKEKSSHLIYNLPKLDVSFLFSLLQKKNQSHKYSAGSIAFIGGEEEMEGALILASKAFMELGGGIAKLYFLSSQGPKILINKNPSYMSGNFHLNLFQDNYIQKAKVIVVGPGTNPNTFPIDFYLSLIQWLDQKPDRYAIIDGGAIPSFHSQLEHSFHPRLVFTPHWGEWKRWKPNWEDWEFSNLILKIIDELKKHSPHSFSLLLKSYITIFFHPEGKAYVWNYPNPQLATMGTGDLLTGILGLFLAKGYALEESTFFTLNLLDYASREINASSPTSYDIYEFLKIEFDKSKLK